MIRMQKNITLTAPAEGQQVNCMEASAQHTADHTDPPAGKWRAPTGWALRAAAAVALISIAATAWWFLLVRPAAAWQSRWLMASLCIGIGLWSAGLIAWRRWRVLAMTGLNLLAVILLTFSFAPSGVWVLAYVALVPWVGALHVGRGVKGAVWMAGLAGLVFWAGNLYWMTWITSIGHAGAVAYLTCFWLIAAWAVRLSMTRRLPTWLALPFVWVALEYARTYLLGFPWLFLAHSQYARTPLIQISDLTGQYGVSFFVAMVNGLAVDAVLLIRRPRPASRRARRVAIAGVCVVSVSLAGLLGYGYWRLGQRTQSDGPTIAVVQQAVPARLYDRRTPPEEVLRLHWDASWPLFGVDCDLVVWPEGAMTSTNPDLLQLDVEQLDRDSLRGLARWYIPADELGPSASDQEIAENLTEALSILRTHADAAGRLSAALDCPILTGNSSLRWVEGADGGEWLPMNDVMLLEGSGLASSYYSKVNPVPFGEYVPFKESWPGLYRALKWFVPNVRKQVHPGREYVNFQLSGDEGQWTLATPICYEGTFARVCRRMVMRDGEKDADILVNVSNDGWFVYTPTQGGQDLMSVEHAQHLVVYCFRAVENRVPVVRAANTGISASIDSNGRILASLPGWGEFVDGSPTASGVLLLTDEPGRAGQLFQVGPKILVDSRVSRYSLIGDVFARFVCVTVTIVLVWIRLRPSTENEIT